MVSSLHVVTVETQRYAFLLFSIVMTVGTGEFFDIRVSFLQHAMSCIHRKLFCIKLISCIKFREMRVYDLIFQCFANCGNFLRFLL